MTSTATTLAHEVLRAMTMHRLANAKSTFLLVAALAAGGYLARLIALGDEPRTAPAVDHAHAPGRHDDGGQQPAPGRMFVAGRVLDPDGKPRPRATVIVYAANQQP